MSATAVCEEQVQVRRERRPCGGPTGITLGQLLTRAHEAVLAQRHRRVSRVRRHPSGTRGRRMLRAVRPRLF